MVTMTTTSISMSLTKRVMHPFLLHPPFCWVYLDVIQIRLQNEVNANLHLLINPSNTTTTESSLELAKACEDGDVAEVKRLLADSHDVNVNFKDEMDLTPLIYATQRGLADVVQLLLLKVRSSRFHLLSLPPSPLGR